MAKAKGRAWKMERASVHVAGKTKPRSNKYSGGDSGKKPAPGTREQVWVGGYPYRRHPDQGPLPGHRGQRLTPRRGQPTRCWP